MQKYIGYQNCDIRWTHYLISIQLLLNYLISNWNKSLFSFIYFTCTRENMNLYEHLQSNNNRIRRMYIKVARYLMHVYMYVWRRVYINILTVNYSPLY